MAHRGDPRTAVENTLDAVAAAVRAGADVVEVDVRSTLDGVAVLHHDARLVRLHGTRSRVAVLTRERRHRRDLLREGAVWFCGHHRALGTVRRHSAAATVLLSWRRPVPPSTALVETLRPQWFNPWHRLVDADLVAAWQRRGTRVSTWTVDDARRRESLRQWGVDAVVTNLVAAAVAERDGTSSRQAVTTGST